MRKASNILLVALALVAMAGAQDARIVPQESEAQRRYSELNRQIYARHLDIGSGGLNFSRDKAREAMEKLHSILSSEILHALNRPEISTTAVTQRLASVQGEFRLPSDMTNVPFVEPFQMIGLPSMAVAYVILEGGDGIPKTQAHLEFYDRLNGSWRLAASAPSREDFEGCEFFVSRMKSGMTGERWFLAYGMTIGDTGARVKLRLYSYDGLNVRTIYSRDGLIRCLLKVSENSVTLDYDRKYQSLEPGNRVHEVLRITSRGLE